VPVDKKLQSSLKTTLATIEKPGPTNLLNDLKLLASVAPALGKTSRSNAFHASLDGAVDRYLGDLYALANGSSNRLAAAYASPSKTAAQKSLDAVFVTLNTANATASVVAATKLLNQGITQWTAADKLVVRAAAVPPPPTGVSATVTGAVKWDFKSALAVVASGSPGNFTVNSTQPIVKSPFGLRTVTFSMYGVKSGANTLTVRPHDALLTEASGNGTGHGYVSQSGSIQANYNPATKFIAGSFTFLLVDEDDSTRKVTATGTFAGTIQ